MVQSRGSTKGSSRSGLLWVQARKGVLYVEYVKSERVKEREREREKSTESFMYLKF